MIRASIVSLWAFLLLLATLPLSAAPPTLRRLSPNGLAIGQPNRLIVEGDGLSADLQLISQLPITATKMHGTATAARVELEFQLGTLEPGLYPLRVATAEGISNPMLIAVDALATLPFGPEIASLPIALAGNLPGPQVLKTTFPGKKDQRLTIEVDAQRLGSNLRPTVRLYDPKGRQIAWSPPRYQAGGDARCEAILPLDGVYALELHDHLYKAADPAPFRLKLGELSYAEATLPLAIQRGTKITLNPILTNVKQGFEWQAPADADLGLRSVSWPEKSPAAARAPRIFVTDIPEHLAPAKEASAPCGISAVLAADGKEQEHLLSVTPGQKLRIEVQARRFGSPLDGVLTVKGEKGNQLATADDRPGTTDPLVEFAVPNDTKQIQIGVKDMQGRGGAEFFYRLEVRRADEPDFEIAMAADRINIPAGSAVVLPLLLNRKNYQGPITLQPVGLPPEIQVGGLQIPAGSTQALVSFAAPSGSTFRGILSLKAIGGESAHPVSRQVTFAEYPGAKYQPWLRNEIGIAVAVAAPVQLTWQAPAGAKLIAGQSYSVTANLTRQATAKGEVRLRMLTTQVQPRLKIREKNQDKEIDDVARTLRLEGTPKFVGDANSLPITLAVPGDLPAGDWDVAILAELLAADGKTVAATVASPIQRLSSVTPFTLELTSAPQAEGRAGLGAAGDFQGVIKRIEGYQQPVVITLKGLPKEVLSPAVGVPADKADFTLPLQFANEVKPAELKNLKLIATADPGNIVAAKSNEIAVSVKVVAGEKPTLEPTKEIFDEDPQFVSQLTEGKGQANVEPTEKFAGKIALKVTPNFKSQAMLPGLSVKIRENPGPGEYRYLRFAWKKQGGDHILLQIGHDGQFGRTGMGRPGATFRYHAGTSGPQLDGSLEVDSKVPGGLTVVTRDLFADFGEFTFTGIGFGPIEGAYAVFDHIHLARSLDDFAGAKKE